MQKDFDREILERMEYLVGDANTVLRMPEPPTREAFVEEALDFLNEISRHLWKDPRSRAYADVATLVFWLKRALTVKMRERFLPEDGNIRLGRGVDFHIIRPMCQ